MASNNPSEREPPETFWDDVMNQVSVPDVALIFAVPLVLSAVSLLPVPIQRSLALDFANPSIVPLWSSSYVHNGTMHFIRNAVSYCLFAIPGYLFFMLADERKLFWYIFALFLFIAPPIISLASIVFIGQGIGAGFSGIAAAFVGLLPVSIFIFLRNRVSGKVGPSHGLILFLIVMGITASIYSGVFAAVGILITSFLLLLLNIRQIGLGEVRKLVPELVSMNGYFEFMLVCGALFLLSPVVLFPQDIVHNDHAVNILSHYVGLIIGFVGPVAFCSFNQISNSPKG